MAMDHGADDADYRWQDLAADTPQAIRDALELPAADAAAAEGEPVRVVRGGMPVPWPDPGELLLEDGRSLRLAGQLPADLPPGYHDFFPDQRRAKTRLIVTPGQCLPPSRPQWGWVVQLYAARSAESWGIGDLADLRRLASWAAGRQADLLMLNPLGAAAPTLPQAASPYYPSSRRFRNPLYLRVEEVPGAGRLGPRLGQLAAAGQALQAQRHIDRDAVFR